MFPRHRSAEPLDGRLLLLVSTDSTGEPRFQISDDPVTQEVFGIDIEGPFRRTPRPGKTDWLGHISVTLEQTNHRELALASRGRSGDQWDIWQAVFSPAGEDGYPRPIWNKRTGEIDRSVAEYWRESYDLSHILRRDWAKGLGAKLRGKLHLYVGDMDNYYLNNAVYLVEDFLKTVKDPPAEAEVDYGDRAEHCWNGDQSRANAYSRLRYHQMFIPPDVHSANRGRDPRAPSRRRRHAQLEVLTALL